MKIVKVKSLCVANLHWSPVTGCRRNCWYCSSRPHFVRKYGHFDPTFHQDILDSLDGLLPPRVEGCSVRKKPYISPALSTRPLYGLNGGPYAKNVQVCTDSDLFGDWVPGEWVDAVLEKVRSRPDLDFLFFTKYPHRMTTIRWPENVMLGTSVTEQKYVSPAEEAFAHITDRIRFKFVALCPLLEPIQFNRPELFRWFLIGGVTHISFPFRPAPEWVEDLIRQARGTGAAVYLINNFLAKTNPKIIDDAWMEKWIREFPVVDET
jgi:protein gp37